MKKQKKKASANKAYLADRRSQRRRRWLMALVILGFFIAANFLGGSITYALLYASILLPVVSLLHTVFVYMNFKVVQRLESRFAVKEEPTGYICTISNESAMPFPAMKPIFHEGRSTVETAEPVSELILQPHSSVTFDSRLVCHCRGEYVVGLEKISITDLMGLFTVTYPIKIHMKTSVLPRIVPITELGLFTTEGQKERHLQYGFETSIDNTSRDYEPGDDPRLVHWKASAKVGHLLTRTVAYPVKPQITVVMPLAPPPGGDGELICDCIIETVLAIANYAVSNSIEVAVLMPGGDPDNMYIRTDNEFREFYELCCTLRFDKRCSDFPLDMVDLGGVGCAVVADRSAAKAMLPGLEVLEGFGMQCAMVLCSESEDDELYETVTGCGADFRRLTPGEDIVGELSR